MIIIPAIDLKDGCCVRLRQGRADDVTHYSGDPVAMAREWEERGARYLHVVDLDGAFRGEPAHAAVIAEIARAIAIPVEVGGGLRTDAQIEALLEAGVSRAILGTRALEDAAALNALAERFGDRLAVGIDARDGYVQVKGWVETTGVSAGELAQKADSAGISTIIYTDTSTDGMLQGPNLAAVEDVCRKVECSVIASGGISTADDIRKLCELKLPNLAGAIVGKALYDNRVTLEELHKAAER